MNPLEFIGEFQSEAGEKLDIIASQLLRLERDASNPQPIREMFLAAHTIKGGAAMLRLTDIEFLAHALEDMLTSFRDQARILDASAADVLFQTIDLVRGLLSSLSAESIGADVDPRIARFAERLRGAPGGTIASAPEPVVVETPAPSFREEISISTPPAATEPPAGPAPTPGRALVVDDSPTVRELWALVLADAGVESELVDEGRSALAQALDAAEPFSLVISAVQLRGIDGFELTSTLRRDERYRDVPVLLTSADADADVARRAAAVGATGLVRKNGLEDEQLTRALGQLALSRAG